MSSMMKKLWQRTLAGLRDGGAASAVEYAIVLCLIILVCMSTLHAIGMWNAPVFALLTEGIKV